jgi:hypothetical protein
MAMASFAVILLWLSSLAVAVSLVRYVVASPTTESLYASCSYAYDVSVEEKQSYEACVNRQLDRCQEVYNDAVDETVGTVETNFDYNTDLLDSIKAIQSSCSDAVTTVKAALGDWQEGGTQQVIYYTCDDDDDLSNCVVRCSQDDNSNCTCDSVQTMIGDISSVRTEAFSQASEYKTYSRSTVSSLAAYTVARTNYDANYIDNKTAGAQAALANALDVVSVPYIKNINLSFAALFPDVRTVCSFVCLTRSPTASRCTGGAADGVCVATGRGELHWLLRELEECERGLRAGGGAAGVAARAGERRVCGETGVACRRWSSRHVAALPTQEFAEEADKYADKVSDAVSNMLDFYEGFQTLVDSVGIDTSDLGDWFDLEISDFIVSDPVELPPPIARRAASDGDDRPV